MTFKADSQADVALVTFNDLNAAGDALGKTPITVAKAALEKAKSLDPEDQDIGKLMTTMGL
jgi:hypothetical protein